MKKRNLKKYLAVFLSASVIVGSMSPMAFSQVRAEETTSFTELAETTLQSDAALELRDAAQRVLEDEAGNEAVDEVGGEAADYSQAKTVTVMEYIIGSDLESQGGAATEDLKEMLKANTGSNLNVIVETGGAKKWRSKRLGVSISSKSNQRYQLTQGKIKKVYDAGERKDMTDPDTLADFVAWTAENYPADRYVLVLWDHGGGTGGGFGVDQFHKSGTLTVDEVDAALDQCNVHFDFIGFDACLMATIENGLTLAEHADYYVASEETESGMGWYYTNWLKELSKNPSIDSAKIGETLTSDFVKMVKKWDPSSESTLSMVDLNKLSTEVLPKMETFGEAMITMLGNGKYKTISKARKKAKYYYDRSLDLIDMVDFCKQLGTTEATELKNALSSCVVANNTYKIKNSNGISCYIPFKDLDSFSKYYKVLKKMNLGSKYLKFVSSFATVTAGGQLSSDSDDSAFDDSDDNWDDSDDWSDDDWSDDEWDDWDFDDWDNWSDDDWSDDDWDDLFDDWDDWGFSMFGLTSAIDASQEAAGNSSTVAEIYGAGENETTITLNPDKKSTTVGKKFRLTPTIKPKNSKETVTYKSSNPSVASVSQNGVVIANKEGKAVIAAILSDSKQVATCKVVVKAGTSVYSSMKDNEWFNEELATAFTNYYSKNALTEELYLTKKGSGKNKYFVLDLKKKDWDLIEDEQLQVYMKDKKGGYYLLGSDSYAERDKNGDLKVDYGNDYTWWSIDGQIVPYYSTAFDVSGKTHWYETGQIQAKVNGQKVDIITRYDDEHQYAYILGYRINYDNGIANKGLQKLKKGDKIQYLASYFDKKGKESLRQFGKTYTVKTSQEKIQIVYNDIGNADTMVCYKLTDIFDNDYWTEKIYYD